MIIKFNLLLFIVVKLSFSAKSQPLPLETYTPANGLVDTRIIKAFQDSRGRMFFLTREGFSVFDGQRFVNFTEVNGIRAQMCNDIMENEDRSVDIYTFGGDIFRYRDGRVSADTSQRKALSEFNTITRVGNNDYLLATNYRLYRKKDNRVVQLHVPVNDTMQLYIDRIIVRNNRIIFNRWAGTRNKTLWLYDLERQQVTDTLPVMPGSFPITDPQGNTYFGSQQWQQLDNNALDHGRLIAKPLWFRQWLPQAFGDYELQFDNGGYIWLLSTNNESCRIDPANGTKNFYRLADGLLSRVNNVFRDREHNYWFIERGKGVQKLQQSPLSEINTLNGHPLEYVYNVNNTADGQLVVRTPNYLLAGTTAVKNSSGSFIAYRDGRFYDFRHYNDLTDGKALHITVSDHVPGYKESEFFPASQTGADKEGRIIIPGKILFTLDKKDNLRAKRMPYFMDNVAVDEDNSYWCFLRSNELFHLAWQADTLQTVYSAPVPDLNPRFAVMWKPGVFAVGTREKGIQFITIKNGRVEFSGSVTRNNGLSNNFVQALLKRNDHELVAGTATGLDIVNITGSDTLVRRVAAAANLFSAFSMLAQTGDSAIYARTEEGLLYRLEKIAASQPGNRPHLYFSGISVNGERKDVNERRFKYTNNNFRFSTSYPSFIDNRNIIFAFELHGNNRSWQQQTTAADFEINNLQPGHYTLTVTAKYPGKIYPDETIAYEFTILPPVWRTWWFITLSALVALSVILLLARAYFRRRLEKQKAAFEQQQAIERERTRIATDMHDDLGAGLSRIKFISEKILLQHRNDASLQPELEKISGYSDEMAEKMGEIVWALNQRYDTLGDLVSFCRAYASEYLQAQQIRLQFEEEVTDRQLKGETRRNLFLVLKESLHNTVKHSGATEVHISFSTGKGMLHIQIKDNGKGVDFNHIRPFANGLENMKKRVKDCGGAIVFTNDDGLKIRIDVPLE